MNRIILIVSFALSLIILPACNSKIYAPGPVKPVADNIILLIGDGMGLTQMSTLFYYGDRSSHFSRFHHIGLHRNAPNQAEITDSAAGATAFSTGYKSFNRAIGVDADSIPRETILEWAAGLNKKTGIVSTSTITHATPASFYAHVVRPVYA